MTTSYSSLCLDRQQLTLVEVRSERGSAPDVPMQNYGSLRYRFPAVLPQMPLQLIKTKNPEQRVWNA